MINVAVPIIKLQIEVCQKREVMKRKRIGGATNNFENLYRQRKMVQRLTKFAFNPERMKSGGKVIK